MDPLLLLLALVGVAAGFYTHRRLRDFALGEQGTLGLRISLLLLGAACGAAIVAMTAHPSPVLPFLVGFGIVHVPSAMVLMLKAPRSDGHS